MKKHKYHAEIDLKPALSEEQLYDRITRDFALLANLSLIHISQAFLGDGLRVGLQGHLSPGHRAGGTDEPVSYTHLLRYDPLR